IFNVNDESLSPVEQPARQLHVVARDQSLRLARGRQEPQSSPLGKIGRQFLFKLRRGKAYLAGDLLKNMMTIGFEWRGLPANHRPVSGSALKDSAPELRRVQSRGWPRRFKLDEAHEYFGQAAKNPIVRSARRVFLYRLTQLALSLPDVLAEYPE